MQNPTKIVVIVLVVVLALVLLSGAWMMMGFGGFGMGHWMMYGNGGMMSSHSYHSPLATILSIASWVLILSGIALLVIYFVRSTKSTGPSSESPLDILKTRYARGEIAKEQFDAIKRDLGV